MKGKKEKTGMRFRWWQIIMIILAAVITFMVVAGVIGYSISRARRGNIYVYTQEVRQIKDPEGFGTVEVFTMPLDPAVPVDRACYTPSGRVLLSYDEGQDTVICTMNDDGTACLELFRGKVPGKYRLMLCQDNARVLLGDAMLECPEGQTLDTCAPGAAILIPVEFPAAFADDPAVTSKWTEIIFSPDGQYIAWTIRRSDCGAANAIGRLVRYDDRYVIEDAKYISAMNAYSPDPEHDGQLLYSPVIGGEVKQFVHGGAAISLVGADPCGMGDSVIQDIATGEVLQVTHCPGYDETTLLSPDEKLGIVMTSRFSKSSDLAVLGLVPRPYGDPLHNIMAQIYMYSITGVRNSRQGNIGPALIDMARSMEEPGYVGVDLSDPEGNWVYHSPMSWKNDSTRAMWMERQRNGNGIRIQIVSLPEYQPGPSVATVETPQAGDYGDTSIGDPTVHGRIPGKVSGYAEITKESGFLGVTTVTVTYENYSDDGRYYFNGTERSSGSVITATSYTSHIRVTNADGKELGGMDVELRFSAAYRLSSIFKGATPELDLSQSSGTATWDTVTEDISVLVP